MDYEIQNKFSDALKYAASPCNPLPSSIFIERLNDAAEFLFQEDKSRAHLSKRRMSIQCLETYLEAKGIQEVVPDESFFKRLSEDFKVMDIERKEIKSLTPYDVESQRRIVQGVRYLINCYFYPQKLVKRRLIRVYSNARLKRISHFKKLSEPFTSGKLIELLHKANESVNHNKGTFRIFRTRIEVFGEYLNKNKIQSLIPNEIFLLKCLADLEKDPPQKRCKGASGTHSYSAVVKIRTIREIRILVNRYFLSQGITKRPILIAGVRQRYERFFRLTKNTQRTIAWFENHGRLIKALPVYKEGNSQLGTSDTIRYIYRITDKKLKPASTVGKVNHVLNFLNVVGKNGIELVDESDLKKFIEHCDAKKLAQKQDYLAHIATFFINAQAEGFISDHPFKQTSLKMRGSNVRVDFIAKEGIDALLDMTNLDLKNAVEVRNAAACALGYDTGLRAGELYGLDASNISKDNDGDVYVSLEERIQKGTKPKTILYLLFDETKAILKYYLEVTRPTFNPKDNSLFISTQTKERMHKAVLEDQIRSHMRKKGIKTFYKKNASAHHLRHSFATLNIQPLGPFSLYEIVERLRHCKYETAKKHYIHSNPICRSKNLRLLRAGSGRNLRGIFSRKSLWLNLKRIL